VTTRAERQTLAQCGALDRFFFLSAGGSTACAAPNLDAFLSTLNGDFALDGPLLKGLVGQMATTQPDQAALLMAATLPRASLPRTAAEADRSFNRLMTSTGSAVYGGGNIGGNIAGVAEAALRAAWRRQALSGFRGLLSGAATGTIHLGPHISIEPRNIGRGGALRKGARLMVRIRNLPMTVVHSLPAPIVSKAAGQSGAIRVGATDLRRMSQAADAVADARVQSIRLLRSASGRLGGSVLAFGPSAALDFYDSASWNDGALSVNWRGLAVRSARSQSGNLVGFGAGMAAASGAVALGVVAAVGWPVVLVGLGAGVVAQIAWGYFGADEAVARRAEKALR
jgi:hypothetical protein